MTEPYSDFVYGRIDIGVPKSPVDLVLGFNAGKGSAPDPNHAYGHMLEIASMERRQLMYFEQFINFPALSDKFANDLRAVINKG